MKQKLPTSSFGMTNLFGTTLFAACLSVGAQTSLKFNGSNNYVAFGQTTSALGASNFTVECWIKRMGTGASTANTGGGGISAFPIIAKGRGESESQGNR